MPRAGIAITENFGDLLEPGMRKIYTDQYAQVPEMRPMLYNVQPSSTSYEKDSDVGSLGDMEVFKGTVPYDDVGQGYDVTYTHIRLAKGFKVERDLFEDDLYNIIAKKPRGLSLSAARTFEKYSATPFNTAFSGSGTIVVDGVTVLSNTEGQALCSSSHPYSPDDATTQDNALSSAISPTAVETTRRAFRKFKDDRGNFITPNPDLLLVPVDREETAWEIISSKGKVDTSHNNANFHFGKYKLAVWDYLTDSTNWFMIDSLLMKMYLNWFDRIPLQFYKDKEFDTLIAKFANTARISYGWTSWEWIIGHSVAD